MDESDEEDALSRPPTKKKLVAAPHEKPKFIRSNKQALSEVAQSIKIYSKAKSKSRQKNLVEDQKREDRFLQFKQEEEKDCLHEMRMAQRFIAAIQNKQHSTQPSTLYPPRGNQVPFYFQHMHRSSPVSPIENNSFSTLKQHPASVNSYNDADTPHCSQIFSMDRKTVKTNLLKYKSYPKTKLVFILLKYISSDDLLQYLLVSYSNGPFKAN